ncbi:MAG TPA: pyridoxal phosphate-dependent aminotransferase, partial [Bellilinea sp.]|nr:pyridoxal phosphate-dependent aminotransferase [Bellilinea sp.]
DVSGTGLSGAEVAQRLIDEALVGVTPGGAFGAVCDNHLRMSFATSDAAIEQSLERMARVFAA